MGEVDGDELAWDEYRLAKGYDIVTVAETRAIAPSEMVEVEWVSR